MRIILRIILPHFLAFINRFLRQFPTWQKARFACIAAAVAGAFVTAFAAADFLAAGLAALAGALDAAFAGALAALWFLLLRNNYISVEENPWACKTLREVLNIAGAIGLVIVCILSTMISKDLGDSLTPGWASFITMVIWPAASLALAVFGGKLRR